MATTNAGTLAPASQGLKVEATASQVRAMWEILTKLNLKMNATGGTVGRMASDSTVRSTMIVAPNGAKRPGTLLKVYIRLPARRCLET